MKLMRIRNPVYNNVDANPILHHIDAAFKKNIRGKGFLVVPVLVMVIPRCIESIILALSAKPKLAVC
jgi:hypothetical protein